MKFPTWPILRGASMGLPSGQTVARFMGLKPIEDGDLTVGTASVAGEKTIRAFFNTGETSRTMRRCGLHPCGSSACLAEESGTTGRKRSQTEYPICKAWLCGWAYRRGGADWLATW